MIDLTTIERTEGGAVRCVEIEFDGTSRVGVRTDDPEAGDPTLVLWDDNGESVLNLHLGNIDWGLGYEGVRDSLLAQLTEDLL